MLEKGRVGRDTRVAAALLLRRSCFVADSPSLFAPRTWGGRASWGTCKREIRWRGFYPHHLSRVNKKQSPCSLEELHLVQLVIFVRKKCV